MASSPAYDPDTRFPDGQAQRSEDPRVAQIQGELQKATDAMKHNADIAMDRGGRINELNNKTDNLAQSANGFRRGANRVRKDMWWKNMKMKMCIAAGIIILILIIVIPIVVTKS